MMKKKKNRFRTKNTADINTNDLVAVFIDISLLPLHSFFFLYRLNADHRKKRTKSIDSNLFDELNGSARFLP